MRSSHSSVSSAGRLGSWLAVVLGLAAYVGLVYGLTALPLQLEVPLPHLGAAVVPPVVYALLVLAWVRRPSIGRWLVGTAVLSGVHVLLTLAREPLTTLLDPALAGRPLPWILPPPLPELVGVILLLVPLRDLLRAPVRLPRERTPPTARTAATTRGRAVVTRPQPAAPAATAGSLSEIVLSPHQPASPAKPVVAPVVTAAAAGPVAPTPDPVEPPSRRRPERRRPPEPTRATRRSDVV